MMEFDLDPLLVAAASRIIADQVVRHYLSGVHVQPSPEGGALIVATDGHVMAVFHDREGQCPRHATLSSDFKGTAWEYDGGRLCFELPPQRTARAILATATFPTGGTVGHAVLEEIEGSYPDIRPVIRKARAVGDRPPRQTISVKPSHLAACTAALDAAARPWGPHVYIRQGADGVLCLTVDGVPSGFFILPPPPKAADGHTIKKPPPLPLSDAILGIPEGVTS